MNSPATLEMITGVRIAKRAPSVGTWLRRIGRSLATAKTELSTRSNGPSSGIASAYRLGDAVHHSRFGAGQVMAHWPDGSLHIRFDGEIKSRKVWPSFLNRVNGRPR